MKRLDYLLISTLLICFCSSLFAQNQPAFEQYHFNQLVLNPAYAGSKNTFETNFFLHRQDVKMPGAPSTESVTIHAPLASQKLGLGIKFYHDHIGVTDKYFAALDAAYHMFLGKGVLSAGLEFSICNYELGYTKLEAYDEGDPAFTDIPQNILAPNVGMGVYYRTENYYAGFSSQNILEDNSDPAAEPSALELFEQTRNYNFSTGLLIEVNQTLSLKPHTLIKYTYGGPLQVDLNMSFIFNNAFWIGGAYKTNNSISILAEYVLDYEKTLTGNEFSFGYAYNFLLDDVQSYLGPTHEIFLGYRFNKHNTKIRSPRFF